MINKFKILLLITLLLTSVSTSRAYAISGDLTTETLFSFGEASFKEGKYAEAKAELDKCLLINPQYTPAKKLLKECEQKLGLDNKLVDQDTVNLALEKVENNIKNEELWTAVTENNTRNQEMEVPRAPLSEEKESMAPSTNKGAWTLKKNRLYAELYTKYYWHNHQFDNGRHKRRWSYGGKGSEIGTELKLEYGYTDRLTLLLYTAAKDAKWKDDFNSYRKKRIIETKPGFKYLLFTEPFVCTLQGKIKFPLDYSEENTPAVGKHQIDAELKLLTAQAWPDLPGYTKFEFGFRGRNEEPSNEIPYFFEFGYNLNPRITLKTTLDGQVGVGSGINEDFTKGTFGPIFKIGKDSSLELGYGNTFAGRNTSAAKEVIVSLSHEW